MEQCNIESRKMKVLVVDDHEIMRQGLAQLIGQEADLTVCGEAPDADGAISAIEHYAPDVAVVDISLKNSSGINLIKTIRERWPELPILVLSMHDETFYAERALRAGARGYVTKAEVSAKVVEGIREVLNGGVFVSKKIAKRMLRKLIDGNYAVEQFPLDRLTDREFEVFELIGRGQPTRGIAERLHVSPKTIEAHREHIKRKLGINTATELLTYAVQWSQVDRDS